jgi:ATP-dependent RNA helicase SUPV3L1/SUV3
MPVAARRHQIAEFIAGRTEVLVSTDVLGHGVNLPCRAVVFAETSKFDGVERRELLPWEVAQIAGRAGRFGLLEDGAVGWLAGLDWLAADARVVERGLVPPTAVGPDLAVPAYRRLARAQLGPARADFDGLSPHRWPAALELWARAARAAVKEAGWLRTASVAPLRDRLLVVGPQRLRRLSRDDAWSLAVAPVDAEDHGELLSRFADALLTRHSLADLVDRRDVATATLEEAEQRSAQAAVLRWFTRRHPGVGGIGSADADALEAAASARVIALVPGAIQRTPAGRCASCGREAAPWFDQCDGCYARGVRTDGTGRPRPTPTRDDRNEEQHHDRVARAPRRQRGQPGQPGPRTPRGPRARPRGPRP